MAQPFKWPFAAKSTVTPIQVASMIYGLVVEQGQQDKAGALGFPLKRPASEALFAQCRLYRDAGAELMLQAKAVKDPTWRQVLTCYQMLLNDNPNTARRDHINLAAQRLAWLRLQKESTATIEGIQEWGLSWLNDVGHGDEDNWVTQGLVVIKWECYLKMLSILIEAQRLVIPAAA